MINLEDIEGKTDLNIEKLEDAFEILEKLDRS